MNNENWAKFSSDLDLPDLEESESNETDKLDSETFYCLLKDKWLGDEKILKTDKINELKDALKQIDKESLVDCEEYQNLISSGWQRIILSLNNSIYFKYLLLDSSSDSDTSDDESLEKSISTTQKVVEVITEHSEIHTITHHGSEEKDEDDKSGIIFLTIVSFTYKIDIFIFQY